MDHISKNPFVEALSSLTVTKKGDYGQCIAKELESHREGILQGTSHTKKGLTSMVANPLNEKSLEVPGDGIEPQLLFKKRLAPFTDELPM